MLKAIIAIIAFILIVGSLGGGYYLYTRSKDVGAVSVPTAPNGAIVQQLFGYAKCEATGQKTEWLGLPLRATVSDNTEFQFTCSDPGGCQLRFDAVCNDGGQGALKYKLDNPAGLLDSTAISANGVVLNWAKDENHLIYLSCGEAYWWGATLETPESGGVQYNNNEYGIYLYTEGYGRQGLFDASLPDCTYVSADTDLRKLFDAQPVGTTLPSYGSSLGIGRTESFTVGWVEAPVIGNFNPGGQYNNKDVICRQNTQGAEIVELDIVSTIGGKTYYMEGSVLASGISVCCPGSTLSCSEGFYCEDYACTTDPITCDLGECNAWQKGKTIEANVCEYEDGNYYQFDKFCDQDACLKIVERDEVPCCPGTCGVGQKCDINEGCVDVNILKDCPTNECCIEGGEYEVKACGANLECCFELGDAYRGLCKDECEVEPECTTDADCPEGWSCNPVSGICIEGDPEEKECKAKGGEWVVIEETCTWFQKTFQGCKDTSKGVCRIPHTPIIAVILVILSFVMIIAGAIWVEGGAQFPIIFFGAILAIINVIWLILAGGGLI